MILPARRSLGNLLAVSLIATGLLGCGGGSTSSGTFARFTPDQAIAAFTGAGLDVGASRPMTKDDYGLAPLVATAGIRFFIASLGPDNGGRVMSFASQGDLDRTKAYYEDLGKRTAAFFSWTFVNGNLLVQINGDLPEANARAYEAALKSLSGSSTSPALSVTTSTTTTTPTTTAPPASPTASGLLSGNYTGSLPPGDPGKIAVIATAPPNGTVGSEVPVIVRNNTTRPVGRISLSATARNGSGALIGSGSDQGLKPGVVNPGEIAIGYVYFQTTVPSDASIDITAAGQDPSELGGTASLKTTEFNVVTDRSGPSLVGSVLNNAAKKVSGPISVLVECFDDGGNLSHTAQGFATPNDLNPGDSGSFTIGLGKDPCPMFLIGASGYNF